MNRTTLVRIGVRCLCAIALATLIAAPAGVRPAAAEVPAPATPVPPVLDIQITPSHQSVARQEKLVVYLIVTNKSSTDVMNLHVDLKNDDFSADELPTFPFLLQPFSSVEGSATISAKSTARFIEQQILFIFTYNWSLNGQQVGSAQGSAVTLQVTRRFNEEAQGILGGNAAFLYLLLPIIPLFLGFQLVNGIAVAGKLGLPAFKADYLLPAFLFAVLLNLVLIVVFQQLQVDYSDPVTMLVILIGSFVLGAIIAGFRRIEALNLLYIWTYRDSDSNVQYLKKALLRPDAPQIYEWVEGKDHDNESWGGILLKQPVTGDPVLGATFQATRNGDKATQDELKQVFNEDLTLRSDQKSRSKLIELLKSETLTLTPLSKVQQGTAGAAEGKKEGPVVTGLTEFTQTKPSEQRPLVKLTG